MRRALAVAFMAAAGWCVIEGLRLGASGLGLWRATGERIAADAEAFLDDVTAARDERRADPVRVDRRRPQRRAAGGESAPGLPGDAA